MIRRNATKLIEAVRGQYCFSNPPQAMPVGDCRLDIILQISFRNDNKNTLKINTKKYKIINNQYVTCVLDNLYRYSDSNKL